MIRVPVRRSLVAPLLAVPAVLAVASGVAAFWPMTGTGTGSAATGTLAATTSVRAIQPNTDAQNVRVAWAPVQSPDGDVPDGYHVMRTQGGVTVDACDSSATAPIDGSLTACDDIDVPTGYATYTVVTVFQSWTAAYSGGSVEVVAHALTSFTVEPVTLAPTAGTAVNVRLTAIAADGGTKPDYTGTQCIVFSGPNPSPSGANPVYPAAGTCQSGSAITFAAGVATATVRFAAAESTVLRATDLASGLFGTSAVLTVAPAAPAALGIVRQPSATATAGVAWSRQPRIGITDAYGNLTPSTAAVSLAVSGGDATVSCITNPQPAVAGIATFAGCTSTKAGTWTLTATSGPLASATTTATTVAPGAPAAITAVSGSTQSATVATTYAAPLVALVADAWGNPVPGATVTFTAPGTGATATLAGSTSAIATTGANGHAASPTPVAGTVAGAFTISASTSGAGSAAFDLAASGGAGTRLAFAQQPSATGSAGAPLGAQPKVSVLDQYGNVSTGSSAAITLAVSGASLSCTSNPVSATNGIAAFAGCAIVQTGTWTMTATSGSLAPATSSQVTVSPATIASVVVDGGSGLSTTVGTSFGSPLVAVVKDNAGTPLVGVAVTFTAPASGARATWSGSASTTATTDATGRATAPAPLAGTTAGTFAITAAAGSVSADLSLTAIAAAPARLAFAKQPPATIAAHAAFQADVAVQDAYGNTVTSLAATSLGLTLVPNGNLGGCSSAATSAGVASFTGCFVNAAGTGYTLQASGSGFTAAASTAITVVPAAPAVVTAVSGGGQTATVNTAFASALVATVADAYGNLVPGATVSFAAPSSGASARFGTATSTTATTNAAGQATSTVPTAGTVAGAYTITATTGSATAAVFAMTNRTGAASKLAFVGQPAGATVATAFTQQPKVAITDAYGNTVTTATGTIALGITTGTGTGGATISGCSGGTSTAGIATFSGCKISAAGTGYTLRATSGSYAAGTSAPFDVTALLVPSSFAIVNRTGGIAGTTEAGDQVSMGFNVAVRASSICSAFTSDTAAYTLTDVVVAVNDAGKNDNLTFASASCSAGLKLGTVTVGSYISSSQVTTFTGSTLAWDPVARTVLVTLGTTSRPLTSATTFTMTFSVSTSILDVNGRAASGSRTWTGLAF